LWPLIFKCPRPAPSSSWCIITNIKNIGILFYLATYASRFLLARITSTCSDQHRCQMWHVSAARRQILPVPSLILYCTVWYWWVSLILLPLCSWGRNPQFPFSRSWGVPRASFGGTKSVPVVYRFEYLSLYLCGGYRKQRAVISFSARIWLLYVASHCVIHYPALTKLSLFAPWSGSAAIALLFLNLGTGMSKWPDSRPDEAPDNHVERWVGRSLGLGALLQK
jgi:hypothetical protein